MPLCQRLEPGAGVVGRRSDREGERLLGVVENQVNLVPALAPVVKADASVEGEPSQGSGDEILQERAQLDGVVDGCEPPLESRISDRTVDEVQLATPPARWPSRPE